MFLWSKESPFIIQKNELIYVNNEYNGVYRVLSVQGTFPNGKRARINARCYGESSKFRRAGITMSIRQARIWYLHHSGFLVETGNYYFVFDYSQDEPTGSDRSLDNGVISLRQLDDRKSIFVFVSHAHADHFNRVVFKWQEERSDIMYILSDDVRLDSKRSNYYFLPPYRELVLDDVKIRTFGSTDVGVSFLVEADGISVFHAGDLNCWYWYYESTEDELIQDKQSFEKEMTRIKGQKVDIAFFPVDPRLKEYFHMGGEYFIKNIKPKLFVPMHFWDQYRITQEFADKMRGLQVKIATLSHRGQQIIYKE